MQQFSIRLKFVFKSSKSSSYNLSFVNRVGSRNFVSCGGQTLDYLCTFACMGDENHSQGHTLYPIPSSERRARAEDALAVGGGCHDDLMPRAGRPNAAAYTLKVIAQDLITMLPLYPELRPAPRAALLQSCA